MSSLKNPGEPLSERSACVLCGGAPEQHSVVYRKWGYPILKCRACGLGSTLVSSDFEPFYQYNRDYFHGSSGYTDGSGGYADYSGSEPVLRTEFRRCLFALRRHGCEAGRLLEIGCAYGFFLSEAQGYFDCHGIEIAKDAVDFCRSRGLEVHRGTPEKELLDRLGRFDAVVLLDVIEHLPAPLDTLRLATRHLRQGGAVMISTGDWDSYLSRLMRRHWRLMTPPEHLFFFSLTTLARMLEKVGLRIVHTDRPWKWVPLGLIAHQLGQRVGARVRLLEKPQRLALPINLFDAVRVIAVKERETEVA